MCNPEPPSSSATRVRVMKCDHAVQLCTSCICGCTVHTQSSVQGITDDEVLMLVSDFGS